MKSIKPRNFEKLFASAETPEEMAEMFAMMQSAYRDSKARLKHEEQERLNNRIYGLVMDGIMDGRHVWHGVTDALSISSVHYLREWNEQRAEEYKQASEAIGRAFETIKIIKSDLLNDCRRNPELLNCVTSTHKRLDKLAKANHSER